MCPTVSYVKWFSIHLNKWYHADSEIQKWKLDTWCLTQMALSEFPNIINRDQSHGSFDENKFSVKLLCFRSDNTDQMNWIRGRNERAAAYREGERERVKKPNEITLCQNDLWILFLLLKNTSELCSERYYMWCDMGYAIRDTLWK